MVDQVISDLLNAKAYLLLHGWHQGNYVPEGNMPWKGQPACMTAAVMLATHPNAGTGWPWDSERRKRFNHAMRNLCVGTAPLMVESFNDSPQCIFEDVLRAFDKAIEHRRTFLKFIDEGKRGQ